MNFHIIYELVDKKGVTLNTLAKAIDMSHTGLTKAIENGTLRVETLEKIASFLGISPCSLLSDSDSNNKFNYFKNEIIESGLVKIDSHFQIYDIRKELRVSESFIAKLKRLMPQKDLNFIFMNSNSLVPTSELIKNKDNYIFDFLPAIKKYAESKNKEELLIEIKNELLSLFKDFIDKVVTNNIIKFLREENLCNDKDIVYILQTIYQSSFGDGSSEIFIGYLSNYFHKKDIHYDISRYY